MSIAALSSAGFSQFVASSSNIAASQAAFQSLQQALASGNLSAAQTAFNSYQSLNQGLASSSASAGSSSSQLATDLTALGSAIGSGDLTTAQAAFATVQSDLKSTPSPAIVAAETAAAETVSWVQDLLSVFNQNGATPTPSKPTTEILDSAYGLGPYASTTSSEPANASVEGLYGGDATGSSAANSSGVDVYA